jgi:hypothetical protein
VFRFELGAALEVFRFELGAALEVFRFELRAALEVFRFQLEMPFLTLSGVFLAVITSHLLKTFKYR